MAQETNTKPEYKASVTTKVSVVIICVLAFIAILLPETTLPEAAVIAVFAIVLNFIVIGGDWLYSND